MEKTPKKTKWHGYRRAMLALFVLLCIVVAVVLALLWRTLTEYEAHTPRAALDHYFLNLSEKEYSTIQQDADFVPTTLNSWEDYFAFLNTTFPKAPGEYTYRRMAGSTGSSAVQAAESGGITQYYAVYDGEQQVGEVLLHEDPNAAHGWRVSTPAQYLPGYTVTAPVHAQVYVDKHLLNPQGDNVSRLPVEAFSFLPKEQAPVLLQYLVEPTLQQPVFTIEGPNGAPCEVDIDPEAHTVQATVVPSDAQQEEYAGYIEQAAISYASFVTDDNTLYELQTHLYPGTDLAQRMAGFYQGWYLEHEGFGFENMQVDHITSYSESVFAGEISFDYLIYQQGNVYTFPTRYHMLFTLQGERWLLLELQVL